MPGDTKHLKPPPRLLCWGENGPGRFLDQRLLQNPGDCRGQPKNHRQMPCTTKPWWFVLPPLKLKPHFRKKWEFKGNATPPQTATKNPPPRNSRGPLRLGMKNSHETNGPTAQRPVMPSCKAATKPNGTEAIAAARRSCKVSFRTGGAKKRWWN